MIVARAAQSGHVEEIISRGIDPSHFADDECRMIWEFMRDHTMKYKLAPSFQVVREQFPQHNFEIVPDATDFVVDRFVKAVNRRFTITYLRELGEAVDDDTQLDSLAEIFLEKAQALAQVVPARRVEKFSSMRERIADYRSMVKTGVQPGIPFGFPELDKVTGGIQAHELVSVAGWQGTGKSTLMQVIFFNAYMNGHTGLFFSLEMQAEAIYRKWDAMAAQVSYNALKAGELGSKDLAKWEKWAERAATAKEDIIVVTPGKCSVDRIFADSVKYKPDIIGVDYITLLHTREGQALWEKVTHLTGALKQTAMSLKTPIVAACQTNIGGATGGAALDNIAYSRSIGQDSDIVLGLHQDDAMKANERMEVKVLKNRDGRCVDFNMVWSHTNMEFREATTKDLFQRQHP